MDKFPLVSIIIPTYNRGHIIEETINSVLNQTYTNWELIIVDDGSSDNTWELISNLALNNSKIKCYKRPENRLKGGNAARNFGLDVSEGEYIKWLDSDDLLENDCLEKQTKKIIENNADANICDSLFFTTSNGCINKENISWSGGYLITDNFIRDYISFKLRWPINAILWRKTVLPKRPFNENIFNSQEWLMHLQMIVKDIKLSFINQHLVLIRKHQVQKSKKDIGVGLYLYHKLYAYKEASLQLYNSKYNSSEYQFLLLKFSAVTINRLFKSKKNWSLKSQSISIISTVIRNWFITLFQK